MNVKHSQKVKRRKLHKTLNQTRSMIIKMEVYFDIEDELTNDGF